MAVVDKVTQVDCACKVGYVVQLGELQSLLSWLSPGQWACVFPTLLIFHFLFFTPDVSRRTQITESPNMAVMTEVEAAPVSV